MRWRGLAREIASRIPHTWKPLVPHPAPAAFSSVSRNCCILTLQPESFLCCWQQGAVQKSGGSWLMQCRLSARQRAGLEVMFFPFFYSSIFSSFLFLFLYCLTFIPCSSVSKFQRECHSVQCFILRDWTHSSAKGGVLLCSSPLGCTPQCVLQGYSEGQQCWRTP